MKHDKTARKMEKKVAPYEFAVPMAGIGGDHLTHAWRPFPAL